MPTSFRPRAWSHMEKIETLSIYFCIPMSYVQGCGAVQILNGSDSRSSPGKLSGSGSRQNVMGKTGKTSFHDILLRAKCPSSSVSGSGSGQNVPAPAAPAHGMRSCANLGRLRLHLKKNIPAPAPSIIFERLRLPTKCAGSSSASLPMWPWPVADNSYTIDLYLVVITSSELFFKIFQCLTFSVRRTI